MIAVDNNKKLYLHGHKSFIQSILRRLNGRVKTDWLSTQKHTGYDRKNAKN